MPKPAVLKEAKVVAALQWPDIRAERMAVEDFRTGLEGLRSAVSSAAAAVQQVSGSSYFSLNRVVYSLAGQ